MVSIARVAVVVVVLYLYRKENVWVFLAAVRVIRFMKIETKNIVFIQHECWELITIFVSNFDKIENLNIKMNFLMTFLKMITERVGEWQLSPKIFVAKLKNKKSTANFKYSFRLKTNKIC